MICGNCGAQLEQDAKFCMLCGNPVAPAPFGDFSGNPQPPQNGAEPTVPVENPAPVNRQNALNPQYGYIPEPETPVYAEPAPPVQPVYTDPTPPAPEKPKKKHTGAIIAIVLVLLLLIGGGVGYYFYTEHVYDVNLEAYVAAEILLEKGDYDGALEGFRELGDFEDATGRVKELENLQRDYDEAVNLLEKDAYEEAKKAFRELGDYRDSENYVKYKVTYQQAIDCMVKSDTDGYKQAAGIFDTIADYEDSADLASICRLNLALDSLNNGDYDEALSYMELLDTDDANILRDAYAALCSDGAFIADLENIFQETFTSWKSVPDSDALNRGIETLKGYRNAHFDDETLSEYVESFLSYCQSLSTCISATSVDMVDYYACKALLFDQVDQIWESHGAFASSDLYNNYVGKTDYLLSFYTVEDYLQKWYDDLESSEYDKDKGEYVSFYNGSGYKIELKVTITYFDVDGNYLYTGTEKTYTIDKRDTVDLIIEPSSDLGNSWRWYMDWEFSVYS